MTKYLKFAPDPDAKVCHCGDGNPDCDHWESCDGCGMDYRKHEGHDCIDGVPVQDLRALAKELRDSLDACETERDRLRAQIAALQSVPQGVEVPEIPVDVLSSIEQDHSCEEWDWRAPAITAWFRRNARNPAVRVEVPPYPDVLVRQSIGHTERHAGIMEGVEWARKNARLVPTPPQADAVAVPRPLSKAPTDRPILAFWQSGLGTISDVVHYFDEEGRFVCWCEMLEYEDNGGNLDFVPRDAQWIELPDALRTSAQAHNGEESK